MATATVEALKLEFPPLWEPHEPTQRLQKCSRRLREHVRGLLAARAQRGDDAAANPAAAWLIDNHSYLQFHIRETKRALPPTYVRGLPRAQKRIRIYDIAASFVAASQGAIDAQTVASFGEVLKHDRSLQLSELWAFESMLKLVIVELLCADFASEGAVSAAVRTLRALELVSWKDFVEAVSAVEEILRGDPAGFYARMDFATRDRYRHAVEDMALRSDRSEESVALWARRCAQAAADRRDADPRAAHIGFYLVGSGTAAFRQEIGYSPSLSGRLRDLADRWPNAVYLGGTALLTLALLAGVARFAGGFPRWLFLLLLVPASQAALEIANAIASRLLPPRNPPCLDFSDGIPDDCKTLVAIPTLLLSPANVASQIHQLEIRYLANRDPNLYFALVTDFPDANRPETERDTILNDCAEGIRRLNARYANGTPGPFYLFHRPRRWNPGEQKWMGYERKRGKLNDLNQFLLGRDNAFSTMVGEVSRLRGTKYVITLDADTQLPRDTAAKMVAAMAHPLNRAMLDHNGRIVREGYALIRPRVSVSMESSGRSRLAQIFSGLVGFDPYATSVSDVYQDVYGQASFTGKGIYDLRAFDTAAGDRFPENAILSHDLIEGEYARTGLLTSIEIIEDYPATYQAFCKRKHRWVRGDWQILLWLFPRTPAQHGSEDNPLPLVSRWKIFDNLRRSTFEVFLLAALAAGWITAFHPGLWTVAVLGVMLAPVYVDLALTAIRLPERHLLPAFFTSLGEQLLRRHRDALVNLMFVPHQAILMVDAIVRTLVRRFVTHRRLLQWETMAQTELSDRARMGMVEEYFYIASLACLILVFTLPHVTVLAALLCGLWVTAPFMAAWLNEPPSAPAGLSAHDRVFLREAALRTWRFFADHTNAENHWLAPDNVQEDPALIDERISPTNIGLLATAHLAASDFGYLTPRELSLSLERVFESLQQMPREHGHFFNWYDTLTLQPQPPLYISSVDSGNLAASLCALQQGCLEVLRQPAIGRQLLDGLRDHAVRLRDEIPYALRTIGIMRLLASLLRQLEWVPEDLFSWEAVLTDARDLVQRIREALAITHLWLEKQGERERSAELRYWMGLLGERMSAALAELYATAPWLEPAVEAELRVNMRDPTLAPLFAELSHPVALREIPAAIRRIQNRLEERLASPERLYPALRATLEGLLPRLAESRAHAEEVIRRMENIAGQARRLFEEMDFQFLFDSQRKLLRIGYDVAAGRHEESCYDLLASEARSAVFLAIAKGDIPREAWFRLGRSLTAYGNRRSLISWSGTLFEYLMPQLHMRLYESTLLERAIRGAVAIHQAYARQRAVPWGISESAHAARDSRMQYQYRAFGVPALSARAHRSDAVVIAPYASLLALMIDPSEATANLRALAARACWGKHGFYDALDYSSRRGMMSPELIRCFMAHHQGMGLLAIDNALLGNRMQERFHADPQVQATEFLLQECMPALVEVFEEEDVLPAPEVEDTRAPGIADLGLGIAASGSLPPAANE